MVHPLREETIPWEIFAANFSMLAKREGNANISVASWRSKTRYKVSNCY